MHARTLGYVVEAITLIWVTTALRLALGATATAVVSVTILAPTSHLSALSLSTLQLDMRGKMSDEFTITNTSSAWREIRVELASQFGSGAECNLHYSPTRSAIPPGGTQVLRLLLRTDGHPCPIDHRLIITDALTPGVPLFEVQIQTAQTDWISR